MLNKFICWFAGETYTDERPEFWRVFWKRIRHGIFQVFTVCFAIIGVFVVNYRVMSYLDLDIEFGTSFIAFYVAISFALCTIFLLLYVGISVWIGHVLNDVRDSTTIQPAVKKTVRKTQK